MSIDLTGQVAIVTGAGGGLGRAHALLLAARGARLVVNDIGTARDGSGMAMSGTAEAVVREIRQSGGEAFANAASVTDMTQVEGMVNQALDTWGRIDILVNNAGILRDRTFAKVSLEDFRAVIEVHLWGAVNCTKAVWDTMQSRQYGRIVMTTSATGLYGNFGQSAYGAAKMAVVGLMNTLDFEGQKHGIHINCLAPSAATRMTEDIFPDDMLATLSPDVVAQGMLALASPAAPSRMILCTGAGTFEAAHVPLTHGCYLGGEAFSPKRFWTVWNRSHRVKTRPCPIAGCINRDMSSSCSRQLWEKPEVGRGFVEDQEHRQWMQPWALTLDKTIDHAARWHGKTEIISRTNAGAIERTNYSALRSDARRMTNALLARGIVPGDRIGTLAMNGGDHLAAWFGIMGMGAICHTLNPRLSDEQLAYIIGHARDRLIFADRDFQEQIDRVFNDCPSLEEVIYFDDRSPGGWRDMLSGMADNCTWGDFAEDTPAGLCYTSGTTGRPKGVVYTHRSNYLHTLMVIQPDVFNISARDSVLLAVPMFHANAWGLTFADGLFAFNPLGRMEAGTSARRSCSIGQDRIADAIPGWRPVEERRIAAG